MDINNDRESQGVNGLTPVTQIQQKFTRIRMIMVILRYLHHQRTFCHHKLIE